MSVTRAICDTIFTKRLSGLLVAAGITITDGELYSCYAWALRQSGGTTADASTATDAELTSISDVDDFLDLVEYRALQNILGNLNDVDISVGPRSEKLNQLAGQAEKKLNNLGARISGLLHPLEAGYISLDFADHGE